MNEFPRRMRRCFEVEVCLFKWRSWSDEVGHQDWLYVILLVNKSFENCWKLIVLHKKRRTQTFWKLCTPLLLNSEMLMWILKKKSMVFKHDEKLSVSVRIFSFLGKWEAFRSDHGWNCWEGSAPQNKPWALVWPDPDGSREACPTVFLKIAKLECRQRPENWPVGGDVDSRCCLFLWRKWENSFVESWEREKLWNRQAVTCQKICCKVGISETAKVLCDIYWTFDLHLKHFLNIGVMEIG